jgi:hypothetical protein
MHSLQGKTGHDSIREAFITNRNTGKPFEGYGKDIIAQARTINLLEVIRSYNIDIDPNTKKICCPFPSHNQDRTASFFYYRDTNSFYCFGCKVGGKFAGASEFVSAMEGISVYDAAKRLVSMFTADLSAVASANYDFIEKQNLFIRFATMIREFIHSAADTDTAIKQAEKLCSIFDTLNGRRKMTNEGIKSVIDKLEVELKKVQ